MYENTKTVRLPNPLFGSTEYKTGRPRFPQALPHYLALIVSDFR